MLLTETCYYIENQVFGGATNRDMSLIKTCFYSRLYGISNICFYSYLIFAMLVFATKNGIKLRVFFVICYCLWKFENFQLTIWHTSEILQWFQLESVRGFTWWIYILLTYCRSCSELKWALRQSNPEKKAAVMTSQLLKFVAHHITRYILGQ